MICAAVTCRAVSTMASARGNKPRRAIMADDKPDPLNVDNLRFQPGDERWAAVPKKIRQRRQQFVQVPWLWLERLALSKSANTYRVAVTLLFLHWKTNGDPIKLANGMLAMDGVSRWSKQRALNELELLELIAIDRRQKKSPIITLIV